MNASPQKIAENFILNDLKGMLSRRHIPVEKCPVKPEVIGMLSRAVASEELTKRQMRQLVEKWMGEGSPC